MAPHHSLWSPCQGTGEDEGHAVHAERLGNIGTWAINLQTGELTWSDRVFEIHERRIERGEPMLQGGIDYYHPEDRPRVQATVDRAIKKGQPYEFTARIVTETGQTKNVLSRGICRRDIHGLVSQVYGVFIETAHVIELAEFVNDNRQLSYPEDIG